jgi:hypothetical protein
MKLPGEVEDELLDLDIDEVEAGMEEPQLPEEQVRENSLANLLLILMYCNQADGIALEDGIMPQEQQTEIDMLLPATVNFGILACSLQL